MNNIIKLIETNNKSTKLLINNISKRYSYQIHSFSNKSTTKNKNDKITIKNNLIDIENINIKIKEENNETEHIDNNKKIKSKTTAATKSRYDLPPAIRQYYECKEQHPNSIVLFRLGDFFEMYDQDAKEGSKILNIVLTEKSFGKDKELKIPMSGVPAHSVDAHISKLIGFGKTVAICDQVEDAESAKQSGRIIARKIVRIITPGTIYEEKLLVNKTNDNNFLCNFLPIEYNLHIGKSSNHHYFKSHKFSLTSKFTISWLDISTGHFFISDTTYENLISDLNKISPSEIVLPKSLAENEQISKLTKQYVVAKREDTSNLFSIDNTIDSFKTTYSANTISNNINSDTVTAATTSTIDDILLGFSKDQLNSAGSILEYVLENQVGNVPHLNIPLKPSIDSMFIDYSTMKSLEITKTYQGQRKGSLLDCIDKTVTSGGSRLLYSRIQSPSLQVNEINSRLELVQFFNENLEFSKIIKQLLSGCSDLERMLQRVHIGKAGPRDLLGIGETIKRLLKIKEKIGEKIGKMDSNQSLLNEISNIISKIGDFETLGRHLTSAIITESTPQTITDGNFIKQGYSNELDSTKDKRDHSKSFTSKLLERYKEQLSFPQLKIKENGIIGYYFEILSNQRDKLPTDQFIHVQTLLNHMRYKTLDLITLEDEINRSVSMAIDIEIQLFNQLSNLIIQQAQELSIAANVLSVLDVSISNALIAKERQYIKPILRNDSNILNIINGRHPTVELSTHNEFVGNDLLLNGDGGTSKNNESLWLITGPNMGGKSTFLRQNAIIILMAQMGSFVPASFAEIGIVDSIFSRVGSSDDISNDRSTFMVEMVETASILKKATHRSFVIMDEIGRGTSTSDGIAIAQACVEHLYKENKSKTLFATHYHELTDKLEKDTTDSNKFKFYSLAIKQDGNDILFTHKIIPGVSSNSFGIFCAKMAGLPDSVIANAIKYCETTQSPKSK